MGRIVAWTAVALVALSANANAQKVSKVPGGDTLVVEGVGKVRLAGVEASTSAFRRGLPGPTPPPRSGPSSPPPALIGGRLNLTPDRSSRNALRALVLGKDVTLEFDDTGGRATVPRVYVFLMDGTFVNAEMVRQGRARVDGTLPLGRLDELRRVEKEAQEAQRGVWAVPK
jgi:micrococcal nuclease